MSDYSVEIKIKNARVLRLMRLAGCNTAADLSKLSGVSQSTIGHIINLKTSPMSRLTGTWTPIVLKLADALNCMPDDMFSDHQRTSFLANNKRSIEMSEAEVELLMDSREQAMLPDDAVFETEQRNAIAAILDTALSPRQSLVLKARLGFDQDGEKTLQELGETLGVGRERVRQIEIAALEKLKLARNKDRFRDLL